MKNYKSVTRTNYFKVTDMKKFNKIIQHAISEQPINIWTNDDGTIAFDTEGRILGLNKSYYNGNVPSNYDNSYFDMYKELKQVIPEDDCIMIFHTGFEPKIKVNSNLHLITINSVKFINMLDKGIDLAQLTLDNYKYEPKMVY